MLLFAFERGLLQFSAAGPALDALFQLPPRIGKRINDRAFGLNYLEADFNQPPTIFPISIKCRDHNSYFLASIY